MAAEKDDPKEQQGKKDVDLISDLIDADLDEVAAGHYSVHFSAPQ